MIESPRILLVTPTCYCDETEEAAGARALVKALALVGTHVEVLTGTTLEFADDVNLEGWLAARSEVGLNWVSGDLVRRDAQGSAVAEVKYLRAYRGDLSITVHRGPSVRPHEPDDAELAGFRHLFQGLVGRTRPDLVLAAGDGRLIRDALQQARDLGIVTAALVDGLAHRDPAAFQAAEAVLVPTQAAATYHRGAFGRWCEVLPVPVDPETVKCPRSGPGHLVFVDPTYDNGVYAFARIAHRLGERRPDIPILVVEGRGTETTLVNCGLDLLPNGNVHLMSRPSDPRQIWSAARVCVLPSLGRRDPMSTAVAAMINGVPLIATDRGGIPEVVGAAGRILPLPGWLTPATRIVPTPAEITAWVDAIIRVWDDQDLAEGDRREGLTQAHRWSPEILGDAFTRCFAGLIRRQRCPDDRAIGSLTPSTIPERARSIVLVPHLNGIEWECEQGLRQLEHAGIKVHRRAGSSAIDMARNVMISDALHDGFESMMFIDADLGFDPADVLRLLALPEPAVCGVYAKKGERALATHFLAGVVEVLFGPDAHGLYPVQYAATGFLRVKATLLRRLIEELRLPLCNTKWGRGIWPFFLPLIVPNDGDKLHYLGEDWAFSYRLGQIGVTTLADTSARLWHWGRYGYGWEDAGAEKVRFRSYNYRVGG